MKNNRLLMLLTLLAIILWPLLAQPAAAARKKEPRLTIEKVAVRGNFEKFLRRICSSGFFINGMKLLPEAAYIEGVFDNESILVGTWEGYRGVRLYAYSRAEDKSVGRVEAWLAATDDWEEITALYDDIVAKERKRWGDPVDAAFLFDGRDGGTVNDTAKMLHLISGKADVHSAWNLADGSVHTSVAYEGGRYYIVTKYTPNLFY